MVLILDSGGQVVRKPLSKNNIRSLLYNIARKMNVTIAQVISSTPLNIPFHRALAGDKLLTRNKLVNTIYSIC